MTMRRVEQTETDPRAPAWHAASCRQTRYYSRDDRPPGRQAARRLREDGGYVAHPILY
jgi:hypothetical protein